MTDTILYDNDDAHDGGMPDPFGSPFPLGADGPPPEIARWLEPVAADGGRPDVLMARARGLTRLYNIPLGASATI